MMLVRTPRLAVSIVLMAASFGCVERLAVEVEADLPGPENVDGLGVPETAPDSPGPNPDAGSDSEFRSAGEIVDVAVEVAPDIVEVIDDLPQMVELPDVSYPPCPQVEQAVGPAVIGMLYWDGDESSNSYYAQGFYPKHDTPIGGVDVSLIGEEHEWLTTSCENGEFAFSALANGTYVLDPHMAEETVCTGANRPIRFPEAIREGKITIVTIGDSIPKWGPEPRFPARLAWHLRRLAEVDNRNIAVPGTETPHWLPGTTYFENLLGPQLEDADVVVISIGGNDIMGYYSGAFYDYSKVFQKFLGLEEFLEGLHTNIEATVKEIRARAPHVDVVYCLYFNYMKASYWSNLAGSWKALADDATQQAFNKARKRLADVSGLTVADMYGAFDDSENLDDYLSDSVHLSALGHKFYARQLLLALGGVIVGDESHGLEPFYGFSDGE